MKATVMCRARSFTKQDKNHVLISICSAYKYNYYHKLEEWKDILRVDFDDITQMEISDHERYGEGELHYVLMDYSHAELIKNFIEKHRGEEFVIHCDAGISRSTAVASFMETYYDYDVEYYETGDQRDQFKNIHVYSLLKRLNYHSAFGDIE